MILPDELRQIILKSGFVSEHEFDAAAKTAEELGKTPSDVLIYKGVISEDVLAKLVAEYYQAPFINLRNKNIAPEILGLINEEAATTFRILPFAVENNILHVAMEDPSDLEAREFIKRKTGQNLKIYYCTSADLTTALGQFKKNIKNVFATIIAENIQKSKTSKTADVEKLATDLPVIKILDTILEFAAAEGASDIHFEAMELVFLIRFRIDGVLRDILELPKNVQSSIVARIKILSQLKIDEHRVPQDGRFKFKLKDIFIALRVSVLPSYYGENIVLRILPESARPLALEELGITGHNLEMLKRNIKKPHGMVLVTGPTGSGKTTTLYSVLTLLNTTEVNICTIEDPVEYGIRRVNQTQVNTLAGLTFAAGLRSLLRHDPNIIMVGEIRDKETVEMAIQSSLTGHLVLSTLHTNDAAGAIPRFLDMGAEGFLVASTVNLIIAQRLVRRICTSCIEKYTPSQETLSYLKQYVDEKDINHTYYRGKGCTECNNRGYKGRIGVYEMLEVNEEIRKLVIKHVSASEIASAGIKNGMVPLLRDGLNKASGGITSIEEVLRVIRE